MLGPTAIVFAAAMLFAPPPFSAARTPMTYDLHSSAAIDGSDETLADDIDKDFDPYDVLGSSSQPFGNDARGQRPGRGDGRRTRLCDREWVELDVSAPRLRRACHDGPAAPSGSPPRILLLTSRARAEDWILSGGGRFGPCRARNRNERGAFTFPTGAVLASGYHMASIPFALDALNFLSADVRNLFGPFINVYLVTSRHWTQTDVGLITTGSGLLGIALQTPIGAAIDVTRAKRAVIVATMAAMTVAALSLSTDCRHSGRWRSRPASSRSPATPSSRRFRRSPSVLSPRTGFARRLGRNSACESRRQHRDRPRRRRRRLSLLPAGRLSARAAVRGADLRGGFGDTGRRHRS